MEPSNQTVNPLAYARLAGVLYLLIIVCGVGGEAFVRGPMVVPGEAEASLANLVAGASAFRMSLLADVVMALADVALAVLLFVMLRPVSQTKSLMAMAFRLVQAAILGINLLNLHRGLSLMDTVAFETTQKATLVVNAIDAHAAGYDFGLFFFAINCVLVGLLIMRASFIPHIFGLMMTAAGAVYFVGSTLRIVSPGLAQTFAQMYVVPLVAELAFCVWLLTRRQKNGRVA